MPPPPNPQVSAGAPPSVAPPPAPQSVCGSAQTPPSVTPPAPPQAGEEQANKQNAGEARNVLPPKLGSEWQKVWDEEYKEFYYWNVSTDETTWEEPVAGGDAGTTASQDSKAKAMTPGCYLCVKHWQPIQGKIEGGIAVLHGDRIQVTWTDDCENGWAYGNVVGEPQKEGYFPQQCVGTPKRSPFNFVVGQAYTVAEHFKGPAGQGGYMSVAPGDVVIVLHQDKDANAWVYGRPGGSCEEAGGWLPEAVLAV